MLDVKFKLTLEIKTNKKRLNVIPTLIMFLITSVDNITRRKQTLDVLPSRREVKATITNAREESHIFFKGFSFKLR